MAHDTTELIFCECGCGTTRPRYDAKGRERHFIKGHSCSDFAALGRASGTSRPLVDCFCANCGAKFRRGAARIKLVRATYCSRACSARPRTEKPITYAIDSNGCWNCTSHFLDKDGYPQVKRDGNKGRLSRYMYEQHKGAIPNGFQVRHTCDNPTCINPDHLLVGTHVDNVRDKVERGRCSAGERHGNAKLTEDAVRRIRNNPGISLTAFATEFGVAKQTVWKVRKEQGWRAIK